MKKSYLYAIITVFIWSTMAAVVKLMLYDIPNLQALSISSFLAAFFLLIMNVVGGKIKQMKTYTIKEYGIMSGLGFVGLFLYSALYYYGLAQLTSQVACILNYLWPMMLVLFSCIILKERVTVMKVVAMGCSFLGIVILSVGNGGTEHGIAANGNLGMISCIVAAACYGLFSVLNKKADFDQNIAMMIMWFVVGICALVAGLVTENWVHLTGEQWLGMFWLGVVVDAIAYLLWALALKGTQNTASVANMAYLTPFLSLLVSALLLKERIELQAVIALMFIIGGILLQSILEGKKDDRQNETDIGQYT